MISRAELEALVVAVIAEITRAPVSATSPLLGDNGILDSLRLVTVVAELEARIESITGAPITIADARALSRRHSPFRSVDTLVTYLGELPELAGR